MKPPRSNSNSQPCAARSGARKRVSLLIVAAVCGCGDRVHAWEGHDWNQWQQVTTWQKPEVRTDQAGRRDLVPLLGGDSTSTNRITTVSGWAERRKQIAATIHQILGEPSNSSSSRRKEALTSDRGRAQEPGDLSLLTSAATTELGFFKPALKPPALEVRELDVEDLEGYTRRHVMIKSEADDWIPAYLLVPKKLSATRVPAMLVLHQTVAQGKEEPCGMKGDPELAFAVELVKRGYVCIAPDVIGFGERIPAGKQPYHDSMAFYRKHSGWSFMGKMIWDVGRVIDYLETLPFVDPKKIGSIGHSHGAYGTLFAAAFEPRISAAVASCGFTTFRSDPNPERWSHLTALIPQLGFYLPDVASIPFDWQHVLALAAPRKLFVWYATKDSIFPKTENLEGLLKDVQQVYQLYGATNALAWRAFDGSHKFPKAGREAAYRWLAESFANRSASVNQPSGARPHEP